jgi:hypothetical protein
MGKVVKAAHLVRLFGTNNQIYFRRLASLATPIAMRIEASDAC